MKIKKTVLLMVSAILLHLLAPAQDLKNNASSGMPKIPVGYDAYRMWDQWPNQRLGARAYMRSTYDRTGGNEGADASHFLFMKDEDYNVSLDLIGKGIVYFIRTNHWHGSPWHYVIDGKDNIVKETGTSDPVHAKKSISNSEFIPTAAFPKPLNWTWGTTKGADLVWTPLPFEKSARLAYSRTRYGTGYYVFHQFANQEQLSQPIKSWNINDKPDADVIDLIGNAGTDIAPKNIKTKKGRVKSGGENAVIANIKTRASTIRALKFTLPLDNALDLEKVRLKITWDENSEPSVDAPLSLFFGSGTFYNRDKKEYLVQGFPINIRFNYPANKVELACYYPMPFFKSAKIELGGLPADAGTIDYEIRYEPLKTAAAYSSYFHATYKDIPQPELGKDLVLLDTKGAEGQEDWSGNFVGTSFIFSHDGWLGTLEGDPRFFFDDSKSPQAYGTGTEEWGGGGDYWGGQNMTLPFAGHPVGCPKKDSARDPRDLIQSAYRFLLADLMPFGKRAVIQLEHGGENLSSEHYETVTYWYGLPKAALIKTDEIDIGNQASEQQHAYGSPEASDVVSIESRYELGIDQFPVKVWGMDTSKIKKYSSLSGKDIYPAHKEDGRHTRGSSEFAVKIDASNNGVLLRRTLDYSFPNQKAEVLIADSASGGEWKSAGIWYLAGSNTCVYSNPRGELDQRVYNVQTSNRRFRDDEFLLPASLTAGKSSIKIKLKHIPDETLLYPDYRFPRESAWSELSYQVYSYVMPAFGTAKK